MALLFGAPPPPWINSAIRTVILVGLSPTGFQDEIDLPVRPAYRAGCTKAKASIFENAVVVDVVVERG